MSPSWYDLLGVESDASDTRIRAAWRTAIADLDPSDRRFRTLNGAAEVLLDPERRAAYDAERADQLAAERAVAEPAADADAAESPSVIEETARGRRPVPGWLLVGLMVLTAVMVSASAWFWVKVPSDASVADATTAALGVAVRSAEPILSYDYRTLDQDQKRSDALMTPRYRKEYDQLFTILKENAPTTKTVVAAQVIDSGVVRAGSDDLIEVILFVDQTTTNAKLTEPVVYKNYVTVTMQKSDGEWLVNDMVTQPLAS